MRSSMLLIALTAIGATSCTSAGRNVQREQSFSQMQQCVSAESLSGMARYDDLTVERQEPGRWLLRAQRQIGSERADGLLVISSRYLPNPEHDGAFVAGSLAYLSIGEGTYARGEFKLAVEAARSGLLELKELYVDHRAFDDSMFWRSSLENSISTGDFAKGAEGLLKLLRQRIQMYLKNNSSLVWRPTDKT